MAYEVHAGNYLMRRASTLAEAEYVRGCIESGNRWSGNTSVRENPNVEADGDVLADKVWLWKCYISAGYAGWDVIPVRYNEQGERKEFVAATEGYKDVYAFAHTALDAVSKAELLLKCR